MFECCHHCTERVVGCHSTCDKYKMDAEKNEKIKEIKHRENALRDVRYRAIHKRSRDCRFFYSKGVKYKF